MILGVSQQIAKGFHKRHTCTVIPLRVRLRQIHDSHTPQIESTRLAMIILRSIFTKEQKLNNNKTAVPNHERQVFIQY